MSAFRSGAGMPLGPGMSADDPKQTLSRPVRWHSCFLFIAALLKVLGFDTEEAFSSWGLNETARVYCGTRRLGGNVAAQCRGAARAKMAYRLSASRKIHYRQQPDHGISGRAWSER